MAVEAAERIRKGDFRVVAVERGEVRRNPVPPFTTSSLQQEASRKLGFGVKKTMRVAQRLDPATGLELTLRMGRYGLFVQRGEDAGEEPRRARFRAQGDGAGRGYARPGACPARASPQGGRASGHRGDDSCGDRALRPVAEAWAAYVALPRTRTC